MVDELNRKVILAVHHVLHAVVTVLQNIWLLLAVENNKSSYVATLKTLKTVLTGADERVYPIQ